MKKILQLVPSNLNPGTGRNGQTYRLLMLSIVEPLKVSWIQFGFEMGMQNICILQENWLSSQRYNNTHWKQHAPPQLRRRAVS